MLPRAHRLTGSDAFRRAARTGRRAGSRTLVVHLLVEPGDRPAQAGFVVSRAVGNAVTRNRVKRRLRHLTREHLDALPGASVLVVRALPPAAEAGFDELRADLARCCERVMA